MGVTIKDIARKLDINFSSVSRALNNKPGVSDETRQLVIRTARDMGYHPNVLARGLVSRTTNTIGVIIPDIINPVFGEITTGIIETANKNNYDVFLCITNWSGNKETDYIYTVMEKQVDGLIIKSVNDDNLKLLETGNIPVVGYESWASNNKFSSVSTDNEKGGYIAAKHIISCGYRKTALFPGQNISITGSSRLSGFSMAFNEYGLTYDESLIYYGEYNINSGYELAGRLLESHPDTDSIITGNDVIALGALKYIVEIGSKPGRDIGIIGFDNIRMADLPQIRLTTIKQPKYSTGRIITNVLLEEISNQQKGIENYPQTILLEPELIIRSTTCRI